MKIAFLVVSMLYCMGVNAQEGHSIKSIYFPGGRYGIDVIQQQELIDFLDSIPNIEQYRITIHSHTDNIGGASFNEWLSEMRSNSAYNELIQYSIDPEAIEIKDFGQFNPVYDNSTVLGRMKNRRVDIILWPLSI